MTQPAEPRTAQSASEQMRPHLERTSRELADLDRQIKDLQTSTARS